MRQRQQATRQPPRPCMPSRASDHAGRRRCLSRDDQSRTPYDSNDPQRRYSNLESVIPTRAAGQAWDQRISSAWRRPELAASWPLVSGAGSSMVGGLVQRSPQSIATPYVIEVDQAGQVRAQVARRLRRTSRTTRRFSTWRASSPMCARYPSILSWCGGTGCSSHDYTTDKGAATLNDDARVATRFRHRAALGDRRPSTQRGAAPAYCLVPVCAGPSGATSAARRVGLSAGRPCAVHQCYDRPRSREPPAAEPVGISRQRPVPGRRTRRQRSK